MLLRRGAVGFIDWLDGLASQSHKASYPGKVLRPPENCHACAALNPRFGAERLVYRDGIRAIQEPDASHELEQAYETAT